MRFGPDLHCAVGCREKGRHETTLCEWMVPMSVAPLTSPVAEAASVIELGSKKKAHVSDERVELSTRFRRWYTFSLLKEGQLPETMRFEV